MSSLGSPSYYSPHSPDQLDGTSGSPRNGNSHRKRVGKACDRCRLKKSKCDGSNPCRRCNQADQVCTFTERKRPKGRVYPDGYVEILESKCQVLIGGLIELNRLRKNLPLPKTQAITGLASGKLANQILKEIGINTTLTDSDLEDGDDGLEHGYCHDDEELATSTTGSPEPTSDCWDMFSHQHQGHSRSQQPQWSQNHIRPRGPESYYHQVMSSTMTPPLTVPGTTDYNLTGRPNAADDPPYYQHLGQELQIPNETIGTNIIPPSPSTLCEYNSTRSATGTTTYTPGQLIPHYYNSDMEVFVDLNGLTPTSEGQNYW
ncbi:uncharacterized protein H6S33_012969 [Morchella sextelata]|uniref:uncharacterized protein n=1 Tax=Morchella sextelata TaxID=1174677 RepID=UPI001D04D42A|nr:uncharacterized protein H6S33_012969 [Morchella sextelata]KAH0609483.1 hypothetical protein H6S33_012969 [Morchella sextelata]